jgi:hypothetical protein
MGNTSKGGGRNGQGPKAAKVVPIGEAPPPVEITTPEQVEAEGDQSPGIPLFSIDGQQYYMPERIGTNLLLKILRVVRQQGIEIAMAELLERVIGEDAYTALMEYDDLTEDQLKAVMDRVQHYTMGKLEAMTGN